MGNSKLDKYFFLFTQFADQQKKDLFDYVLDEKFVLDQIRDIEKIQSKFSKDMSLSEEERIKISREVLAAYQVILDDGEMLSDDSNGDGWYSEKKQSLQEDHWKDYAKYLVSTKHFSPNTVGSIETAMSEVLDTMGDPTSPNGFLKRGLVIGDIQSGKTATYLGLMCKAFDAGYKIIILLSGMTEILRVQTQKRVEEGLIGVDAQNQQKVGVGLFSSRISVTSLTSRANDFIGISDQMTFSDTNKVVFVCKKNVTVLAKILRSLRKYGYTRKISLPLLVIDDEADNASINTNIPENDPTRTNYLIRSILTLFDKRTYVGFTATPFANVFISPSSNEEMVGNDLFPENFIYVLSAPSTYFGVEKTFSHPGHWVELDDQDAKTIDTSHKKDWNKGILPNSLTDSLYAFMIVNSICDLRNQKTSHRSMLINLSRFIDVQEKSRKIVQLILDLAKRDIFLFSKLPTGERRKNSTIDHLEKVFASLFPSCGFSFDEVLKSLYESNLKVQIKVINSSSRTDILNYESYEETGLRVIAIGGLALSRGLTLEGLSISYFLRDTSTYDVLMQMGRWFGYRPGYEDLCWVWTTEKSKKYYLEIHESILQLKQDFSNMKKQGKKPKDFGIRIRKKSEDLQITARNKRRYAIPKIKYSTFFGGVFETPYLYDDPTINDHNFAISHEFLKRVVARREIEIPHPFFKGVPIKEVIEFLSKIDVPEANIHFDLKQIFVFLQKYAASLSSWDVLVMEGKKGDNQYSLSKIGIISLVKRSYDLNGDLVRVNGANARLGGPTDTQYGLNETEKEIINQENQKISNSIYLTKDRNPLLIFYFLHLEKKMENQSADQNKKKKDPTINTETSLKESSFPGVGFALAFPQKDHQEKASEIYYVNEEYDYFSIEDTTTLEGQE